MKKPTGDMYDFVDGIWNPVSGLCQHDCSYCYVKRIANRVGRAQNKPHLNLSEFHSNLGSENRIFVCSGCDLFAKDVPSDLILSVLCRSLVYQGNVYIFQTKNPERVLSFLYGLSTFWHEICTTIETNRWVPDVMRNSPPPIQRAEAMAKLARKGFRTMVTIEPIMDFDLKEMVSLVKMTKARQVNIGADSGGNNLPEPPKEKILFLITELEKFTTVNKKKNLRRLMA